MKYSVYEYYNEPYRGQYHYSVKDGWVNDPLQVRDFRDPKVFRWENKWFMVIAGGPHAGVRAPFIAPCYFGTDIPDQEKLIVCHHSLEEIRAMVRADSLAYLSLENLRKLAPTPSAASATAALPDDIRSRRRGPETTSRQTDSHPQGRW